MQRFMHDVAPEALTPLAVGIQYDHEGGYFADAPVTEIDAYSTPRLDPLCYPGGRPERHGFTLAEGKVWPTQAFETEKGVQFGVVTQEGIYDLDDALDYYAVPSMAERFPIVGFGSNGSPGQLGHKFSAGQNNWGDITREGDHHVLPTLRGRLGDVAAAYSSKLGIHGYVFAELIAQQGADTEVFVNFLSDGQLDRMVRSEGAYELCDLGQVSVGGLSKTITAYGFAGKNEVLLDKTGNPILLEATKPHGSELASMTEEELLDMLAREFGPQLDGLYPHAPVFANSASNLMALMSYRTEYLRRADTSGTHYKNHPEDGADPDQLIGVAFQNLLRSAGRVSAGKLLDTLPIENRGVQPHTFNELYTPNGRGK